MRAPIVVAVNGPAAGYGMSLACAGDIVLANESTRFTMDYTRVGLTPGASLTYYLPRIIGLRRTMELALTNRTLTVTTTSKGQPILIQSRLFSYLGFESDRLQF